MTRKILQSEIKSQIENLTLQEKKDLYIDLTNAHKEAHKILSDYQKDLQKIKGDYEKVKSDNNQEK